MNGLSQQWAQVAQREAEEEILTCRACNQQGPIDKAITVWWDGNIAFGLCFKCIGRKDFLVTMTNNGIEVRSHDRGPIIISSAPGQ